MKQKLALLILFVISLQGYGDTIPKIINEVSLKVNPLDTLQFDEIIASNINFDPKTNRRTRDERATFSGYKLFPPFASSITKVDSSRFKYILDLFSDTATYGQNHADCFEPRFALQFKLRQKEVFRILICEDCGQLESTVPLPAAHQKYYDNEYTDNGKRVIWRRYLKGFSKQGEVRINQLCKTLNLGYCQDRGVRRKELEGCWTDSREENIDSIGLRVFRRCDFKTFPVSRFRFKMELKEGGICSWLYLAPNDAHHMKDGTWDYDEETQVLKIFNTDSQVVKSLKVSDVSEDILRFKN